MASRMFDRAGYGLVFWFISAELFFERYGLTLIFVFAIFILSAMLFGRL